jgi:hypothetical protein
MRCRSGAMAFVSVHLLERAALVGYLPADAFGWLAV